MTKSLLWFINFIFYTLDINAQTWVQVQYESSPDGIGSTDITVDSLGNIYVVGYYSGNAYFGNDTLTSLTEGDFFIAKYNSAGSLIWVKTGAGYSATTGLSTLIYSITVIGLNQIYVVGTFPGTMTIDTITISSNGNKDFFIARFDSSGNCIWAKNAGGINADYGIAIESDKNQFLYTTGIINNYLTNVYFSSDTILMTSTTNRYFIAKYDLNGQLIWVKTSTNSGTNVGIGLSVKENEIFVGGSYDGTSTFDQTSLTSSGFEDIFLIKLDTSGSVIWATSPTEPISTDECLGVSNDAYGNCYITGYYCGTLTMDSGNVFLCPGQVDCFIAKYTNAGEFAWARNLTATERAMGFNVQTDSSGNSYITGEFKGIATFGTATVSSSQNKDLFITKFDSVGNCLGVRNVTNSSSRAIHIGANGISYITGLSFDTSIFDSYTILPNNSLNCFWAKLGAFTGIDDLEYLNANSLIIFSNPNQGNCSISMPEEFKNESFLKLLVIDNSGKTIQEIKVTPTDDKIKLNFQRRAKGIYTVILGNDKKSYREKIIIE